MDSEIPLVDELTQLLAKERLLSEMKLLESELEVKKMREGMRQLLREESSSSSSAEMMARLVRREAIASALISPTPSSSSSSSTAGSKEAIIASHQTILNLSGFNMSEAKDLKLVLQHIHSKKESQFPTKVLLLKNCQLTTTPTFLSSLALLLSDACGVEAFDFSSNDLTSEAFLTFSEAMKLRRQSPQYVALHSNIHCLAYRNKSSNFLSTLGPTTWGLTISLPDFPLVARESTDESSSSKVASAFLAELNACLDDQHNSDIPERTDKRRPPSRKGEKSRAASSSSTVKLNQNKGVEKLVVFGLTDHHLSKQSVLLLQSTLSLSSSSLSHLDLSYSFVAYLGAKVIGEALKAPSCQLVSLNLKGNALSDEALKLLSSALLVNESLIHLNLSSNDITYNGTLSLGALINFIHLSFFAINIRSDCVYFFNYVIIILDWNEHHSSFSQS